LVDAVAVIRTWHGLRTLAGHEAIAWRSYWEHAPEMRPIREALDAVPTQKETT
jgi:hypothetical protein